MKENRLYLSSTDTTLGLLSQDKELLTFTKQRDKSKSFIRVVDSLNILQQYTRVPKQIRKRVRRVKKTTFIYSKTEAIRVSKDIKHNRFLSKLHWVYSSSANISNKQIDPIWAKKSCDIIINPFELKISQSSKIFKIKKSKIKRVR